MAEVNISKLIQVTLAPVGFSNAFRLAEQYNKSLLSISAQTKRLNINTASLEKIMTTWSRQLTITRKSVASLFQEYQKGVRFVTASGFEKSMLRLKSIIGANKNEMQKYVSLFANLSDKFPNFVKQLTNMTAADKDRLKAQTILLSITKQISREQRIMLLSYIEGSGEANEKQMRYAETLNKLRGHIEKIGLSFAEHWIPVLEKITGAIEKITEGMGTLPAVMMSTAIGLGLLGKGAASIFGFGLLGAKGVKGAAGIGRLGGAALAGGVLRPSRARRRGVDREHRLCVRQPGQGGT